jgi:phosphomannomutase
MAARALKTQQVTGICITASHNPAPDNGVKLVEPSGEMLCQDWEVCWHQRMDNCCLCFRSQAHTAAL